MKTELQYQVEFQQIKIEQFLKSLEKFEKSIAASLRVKGYTRINKSPRTVLFPFGEVTFYRSRWYKDGRCYVPVDDKLGLSRNSRLSPELIYHITRLSTYMSYRQVVEVVELAYGLYITKDTVLKAVKKAATLIEEQNDYRYLEDEQAEKRKPDYLFIEGDGVYLTSTSDQGTQKTELSHYVVHEGSEKVSSSRHKLKNKKEFLAVGSAAKKALLDYLYNYYDLRETILITNSDGGAGYAPRVFKEFAKAMRVKKHEHFWDSYHLKKIVTDLSREFSEYAGQLLSEALAENDKNKLKAAFDSMKSMITDDIRLESFKKLYRRFLSNFQYTKPAHLRGLQNNGIGIVESNHRKITYRMKNRGMRWSMAGLEAMSRLIVMKHDQSMRDLFFGSWRKDYQKIKELDPQTVEYFLQLGNKDKEYNLPNVKLAKIRHHLLIRNKKK